MSVTGSVTEDLLIGRVNLIFAASLLGDTGSIYLGVNMNISNYCKVTYTALHLPLQQ